MKRENREPSGRSHSFDGGKTASARRSTGAPANALERWLARRLARRFRGRPITFTLWDGSSFGARGGEDTVCVRLHDRGALYRLIASPDVQLGDLYVKGRVTIEGGLLRAIEEGARALFGQNTLRRRLRKLSRIAWATPSLQRRRRNIHHHYDIGNDFYQLWLDREALQYTCAYYPSEALTLEQAQQAKMDHVCRKLWLEPGDRVVEAGCGWGGFAIFMAKRYGVHVRAFNISHEQILYAREWAERERVADRVEFVEDDYRNIRGQYDAFVSIGMLEHVGPGNYRELGSVIDRSLKPDGRGLIHSIGRDRPEPLNRWIRKRIFPGAYPPTLREMTDIFEPSGLSVLDVENLRLHYARTLHDWLSRYEQHEDRIRSMFDESFIRTWRFYLAGSAAAFVVGWLQLFQVVFARSGRNAMPMTREHVYGPDDLQRVRPKMRSVK